MPARMETHRLLVFRPKRTTATMTIGQLETAAPFAREHVLASIRSSGDSKLDAATFEATQDELKRGWLWDSVVNGSPCEFFSQMLTAEALGVINRDKSKNPISELECLAILCAIKLWHRTFQGKHLVIFTDNNGTLGSMIKGFSDNQTGDLIMRLVHSILDLSDALPWLNEFAAQAILQTPPRVGRPLMPWANVWRATLYRHSLNDAID